jgi:cobaltochelatase CobT
MLRRELAGIFPPILPIQWSREHPSGRRLDLRKASQLPVDPQAALQLWQRRSSPERPDAAVLLLVDLSGSMANGGRIEAAVLAASTCAEVLREMAIPCAVVGFQDRTIAIAGFDEPWTDSLQRRIGEMALEVSETRPGGNNRAGHNDDGPCLLDAAAQLLQRPEHNRVLIVVSDGRPAGRRSGSADLRRAVAQLSDRPMALAAIGIGRGTRHVASYYPEAHGDVPIGAFPAVLARTMARRLRAGERNRGA